ncbi:MAG: hypothetical protein PHF00_13050 [Elusimicrobia bacterium]|nr:hypothetical protein [Elusimicrobiota bacterium]
MQADALAFVEKSGAVLHTAQQLATKVAEEQKDVAGLVPTVVAKMAALRLLDNHLLIAETERGRAAEKLASHRGAVEVANNLLDILTEQLKTAAQRVAMASQGEAVPEKEASAGSAPSSNASGIIGARHGDGDQPESWRRFAVAMGVPSR